MAGPRTSTLRTSSRGSPGSTKHADKRSRDPLPVDVVMVSHVDDDHIQGLLDLTKEQRGQPDLPLDVTSLWHNSFDDLLTTTPKELKVEAGFGAASLGGSSGGGSGEAFD